MRRLLIPILAASVALTGCKVLDRDRTDREMETTGRTKNPPRAKNWADGPTPSFDKVTMPEADSWADPRQPGFDVDREVRGVLAGFVEDAEGRKVRDAFIEVEPSAGTGGGAPVGVQSDRSGYFLIKGLKPRETYVLTARMTVEGKEMTGRVYAQTSQSRSQFIRITLLDGLALPGGSSGTDRPGGGKSDANNPLPPPVVPSGGTGLPLPGKSDTFVDPSPATTNPPVRNDLTTNGPEGIWRPPVTNIPTTPGSSSVVPPAKSASKSINPANAFTLYDTTGTPRAFPTGDLVLLEFMTTSCIPCRKAVPTLKGLQAKYGLRGLELIGISCDDTDLAERRALASNYQRAEGLNYLLYVEPGSEPGKIMKKFNVRSFPTVVLLDGAGNVRWSGSPRDAENLERAIQAELAKR